MESDLHSTILKDPDLSPEERAELLSMLSGSKEQICAGKMIWEWDLSQVSYLPNKIQGFSTDNNITDHSATKGQTWSDFKYMDAIVHYWTLSGITYITACALISLLAIIGNFTILVVNIKKKGKFYNNQMNAYNVSLAAAGLLVGAYCIWTHMVANLALTPEILASVICRLDGCIQGTVLVGSTLTLSLIAHHRFNLICKPGNQNGNPSRSCRRGVNSRNLKEVTIKLSVIWLLAAAVSLPLMLFRGMKLIKWKEYTQPVCVDLWPRFVKTASVTKENGLTEVSCWLDNSVQLVYYISLAVAMYGIPCILIVVFYIRIARQIWLTGAKQQSCAAGAAARRREKRRKVAVLRSMKAAGLFLVCWTPLVITILYACWVNNSNQSSDNNHGGYSWISTVEMVAYMLAYGSAALHPMLYGDLLISKWKKVSVQMRQSLQEMRDRVTNFVGSNGAESVESSAPIVAV